MKNLFPGLYRLSEDELRLLWSKATFIFDTNVLLNLYSYPESAREIFLSVLEKVSERSWIPYQVALEFHRNRFSRIKKSNESLLKIRDKLKVTSSQLEDEISSIEFEKRKTGVNDLDTRLKAAKDANNSLVEALDLACRKLPEVSLDDPIAEHLDKIFAGKTGVPPDTQEALDTLIKDGNDRYEKKLPPGYKDLKDKKDIIYYDRGFSYQAMFGDLILWRQSISYARDQGFEYVVFVTGDRKEDWWNTVEGKILGPSPELVREFIDQTGAQKFWMYTADQFLTHAEKYLSATEVTAETIKQVRETSDQNEDIFPTTVLRSTIDLGPYGETFEKNEFASWVANINSKLEKNEIASWAANFNNKLEKKIESQKRGVVEFGVPDKRNQVAEVLFYDWVRERYGSKVTFNLDFPTIIVEAQDGLLGYELFHAHSLSIKRLAQKVHSVSSKMSTLLYPVHLVVILQDYFEASDIAEYEEEFKVVLMATKIPRAFIGEIKNDEFNVRTIFRNPLA